MLHLPLISDKYALDGGLNPLAYICDWPGPDVAESMVLVLLPLIACRDIGAAGFGVSGGSGESKLCSADGVCSSSSTGRADGVLGSGFSRMESLALGACLFGRRYCVEPDPADAGDTSAGVVATGESRSPVWMFAGLWCGPDIDPNFFMPRRTPDRKSVLSGAPSSSVESDGVENLDSRPGGRKVSLPDMTTHAEEESSRAPKGKRDTTPPACEL